MAVLTTSGNYPSTSTASQIISAALRKCSAIADEETPTASEANNSLQSLNAMVKGWQADQIHVWAEEEAILFLQPKQPQYQLGPTSTDNACLFNDLTQSSLTVTAAPNASSLTVASSAGMSSGAYIGIQLDVGSNFWTTINGVPVGNVVTLTTPMPSQATSGAIVFSYANKLMRPLRVLEARKYIYSSQIETPLVPLSRFDYDYLPNKFNTGTVTQFFFDPQTGNGVQSMGAQLAKMNMWPAPSDNQSGVRFVAQRPLQSFSTLANIPDFPDEWVAAMTWNLALEIGPEYDVPTERMTIIAGRAAYWLDIVKSWDKEPESILFGYASEPAYRGW